MPFEERHGYPLALLCWPPFFSLAVVRGLPLGESDVLPIVELLVFLVGKVAEAVPLRTALCVESDLDVHVNYGGLRRQIVRANETARVKLTTSSFTTKGSLFTTFC